MSRTNEDQVPFPAAWVNGRRVLHVFQVEGEAAVYRTVDEAVEAARRMAPPPDPPARGAA